MHPAVKILTFISILLMMNLLNHWLLFVLFVVMCTLAAKFQLPHFLSVIKRMRLFFISIIVIYALGTPGEIIGQFPISLSPTYEGLYLGWVQIQKLLISLAALCVLLAKDSKEKLMLGLYVLLSPLKFLGFDVERFTARLLLTFNYVEELASSKKNGVISFVQLENIYAEGNSSVVDKMITLEPQPYSRKDKFVLIGLAVSILLFIGLKIGI